VTQSVLAVLALLQRSANSALLTQTETTKANAYVIVSGVDQIAAPTWEAVITDATQTKAALVQHHKTATLVPSMLATAKAGVPVKLDGQANHALPIAGHVIRSVMDALDLQLKTASVVFFMLTGTLKISVFAEKDTKATTVRSTRDLAMKPAMRTNALDHLASNVLSVKSTPVRKVASMNASVTRTTLERTVKSTLECAIRLVIKLRAALVHSPTTVKAVLTTRFK
jgi:hypothetical protein